MPLCKNKKCRKPFIKNAPNQIYCPDCSFYVKYVSGRLYNKLAIAEVNLKQKADESGNPKVWTAEEYDQNFLKSLIPIR